jgi:hypothetical protein
MGETNRFTACVRLLRLTERNFTVCWLAECCVCVPKLIQTAYTDLVKPFLNVINGGAYGVSTI